MSAATAGSAEQRRAATKLVGKIARYAVNIVAPLSRLSLTGILIEP